MSATTFRQARALAAVQVFLPAIAMIVGFMFVILGLLSRQADLASRASYVVGGAGAFALGGAAIWWRIRSHYSPVPLVRSWSARRADVAAGALCMALGLLGASIATGNAVVDLGPAQAIDGRLETVSVRNPRGPGLKADVYLADIRPGLEWECAFDCRPAASLRALKGAGAFPIHAEVVGRRMIALTANGREILSEGSARRRLLAIDGTFFVLAALLTIGSALHVAARLGLGAYKAPDGGGEARYRALLRGAVSGGGKDRP